MKDKRPPLFVTRPSLPPLDEFLPYLESIWANKILTNGGPYHQALERSLCEYLEVPHLSLFTNGTIALVTALQALDIRGEVITTPYSFVATAHALAWNRLTPVFADIDPVTLTLDPGAVEAAVTPRTTAILPVHCYGHPCHMAELEQIARRHGLKLIYDAAHAFGIKQDGRSILAEGDLSVLSFHATKVFQTFEGGAIVSKDGETKKYIDRLKNFGFVDEVTVVAAGINGKMSELNAAFGLLQIRHIDAEIAKRALIGQHYLARIGTIAGIRYLTPPAQATSNHGYFPIMVDDGYPLSRDGLYRALKDKGINARRYFYPLISEMPMYRHLPSATPAALVNAHQVADRIICLPIFSEMSIEDAESVIEILLAAGSAGR